MPIDYGALIYNTATKYLGLNEIDNNKQLQELFQKYLHMKIDPYIVSWCAAFVNSILAECKIVGTNDGHGNANLMARSFLHWGTEVLLKDAKRGDIIVFSRGSDPIHGHVCFVAHDFILDNDCISCIGGNMSNSVMIKNYEIGGILSVRRVKQ